jgi:hypothetical protein
MLRSRGQFYRITKSLLFLIMTLCSTTLSAQFKPGYYYTSDGTVHGLIKLNRSDAFQFKETKNGDKKTLTADEIKSFVVEKDSFALIGDFATRYNTSYDRAFAKVVLINGNGTIYAFEEVVNYYHQSGTTSQDAIVYLVESEGKLEELTRKNFAAVMSFILRSDPELQNDVETKKLKLDDMPLILQKHAQARR